MRTRSTLHRHALRPLAASLLLGVLASPAIAADISGQAAATSDYVWRGSTQSRGDPALQAGLRLASDAGFYASAWASSIKYPAVTQADTELDLVIGRAWSLNDAWSADASVVRYVYPGAAVELDWTELNGTLTWRDRYWTSAAWSHEVFGSDDSGLYLQAGGRWPVADAFRIEAGIGHYFIGDLDADGRDDDYTHVQLGGIWTLRAADTGFGLEARVTAHATDAAAERFFGEDFAGNRVEAALQASF